MKTERNEKGRFLPGNAGRPKGTGNKVTTSLRTNVQRLLEDNYDTIVKDMAKLDPKSRADLWVKLLDFVLPRLSRTEIAEPPTDLETLMLLSPEERRIKIIQLQSKTQNGESA